MLTEGLDFVLMSFVIGQGNLSFERKKSKIGPLESED